jgi:hypothetical protein
MGLFGNLFGKKDPAPPVAEAPAPPAEPSAPAEEATAPAPAATSRTYYFICSGNPSLIDAYDSILKVGVVPWSGEAGHYAFASGDLESRVQKAEAEGLAFAGLRYMGSSGTEVDDIAEVLRNMRVGAYGDMHVAFAVVDGGGAAWVRTVYDELLKEAMSQGILPYYVYVTTEEPAARFLLESFERVA